MNFFAERKVINVEVKGYVTQVIRTTKRPRSTRAKRAGLSKKAQFTTVIHR